MIRVNDPDELDRPEVTNLHTEAQHRLLSPSQKQLLKRNKSKKAQIGRGVMSSGKIGRGVRGFDSSELLAESSSPANELHTD